MEEVKKTEEQPKDKAPKDVKATQEKKTTKPAAAKTPKDKTPKDKAPKDALSVALTSLESAERAVLDFAKSRIEQGQSPMRVKNIASQVRTCAKALKVYEKRSDQ